jgi:SAM-dependent methyltransferase
VSGGQTRLFLVELFCEEQMSATNQIPYPATYQRELSPTHLRYAAALSGVVLRDGPFRYLELGCGRGWSSLIHAACHPESEFHACDRDAEAIAQARRWADALGLENIRFHCATFDALPFDGVFDFIAMHGVYSWVDAGTRATLRALLQERLAPGGLAYVSYNAMPGWTSEVPLRRLLAEFNRDRDLTEAVRAVGSLRGASYFAAHPAADRAVAAWASQPAGYLAQEYLGEACDALWCVDVIGEMEQAGLKHIGSATLRDVHPELSIDDATMQALSAIEDSRLQTLACDFAVNRAFRRDLYVRGEPRRGDALGGMLIGCIGEALPDNIVVPRGRIRFDSEFVTALDELLICGPHPLRQAVNTLGGTPAAARNLLWLVAAGVLAPFARSIPAKLGSARVMLKLIAAGEAPGWIASPMLGAGCPIEPEEAAHLMDAGHESCPRLRRLGINA